MAAKGQTRDVGRTKFRPLEFASFTSVLTQVSARDNYSHHEPIHPYPSQEGNGQSSPPGRGRGGFRVILRARSPGSSRHEKGSHTSASDP